MRVFLRTAGFAFLLLSAAGPLRVGADGGVQLTGNWKGHYVYAKGTAPDGKNTDEVSVDFTATLREAGAGFSGEIVETTLAKADDAKPTELHAFVKGSVSSDGTVQFKKEYDGTGGWSHVVSYGGKLSVENGRQSVKGKWTIKSGDNQSTGRFEMRREPSQ